MKNATLHSSAKPDSITLNMMLRELRLIRKIPSLFIMVFCYPIIILGIFFAIYHAGNITQIPIGIIDQDQSVSSRELIQKISASSEILVAERYNDLHEAKDSLLSANIYAVVMIPPDFEQHMLANIQPEVTTFFNNQYMTVGSTTNRAISSSLSGLISEIQLKKITNNNVPMDLGKNQLKPIDLELHPLFNPTLSFLFTLVSGAFPAALQIIMIFAITASIHLEKKYQPNLNSLRRLTNQNPIRFFIYKCSVYIIIFLIPLLLMDTIMISYYDLPIRGNLLLLLVGDIVFIISSLAVGMTIAVFVSNKISNFGIAGVFSSPAFGFTGLLFPRLAMNQFAYIWGGLLPVTWYIQLRLDQTLRGLTDLNALTPIIFMVLLALIPLCLIGIKFKQSAIRGVR